MRKTTLTSVLILTLMTDLFCQTIKTYNGPFETSDGNGSAVYTYLEDEKTGDRIYDGKFSYKATLGGKLLTTYDGSFHKGNKNGLWNYISKTEPGLRTTMSSKMSGKYKDGIPDGVWTYTSSTVGSAEFNRELFKIAITESATASYKNGILTGNFSFENKQSGERIKPSSLTGQMDSSGYMHGKWMIKYVTRVGGPVYEQTREYHHGYLLSYITRASQSGDVIHKYSDEKRSQIIATLDTMGIVNGEPPVYQYEDNYYGKMRVWQKQGEFDWEEQGLLPFNIDNCDDEQEACFLAANGVISIAFEKFVSQKSYHFRTKGVDRITGFKTRSLGYRMH